MKNKKRHSRSDPHMSNFSFRIISLMHDNPLLQIFKNPQRLLKAAGLKPGQKVLEVGCGPGFFTIPAARIVGNEGVVYAVDVHPLAIERVKEKIEKEGIKTSSLFLQMHLIPGYQTEVLTLPSFLVFVTSPADWKML